MTECPSVCSVYVQFQTTFFLLVGAGWASGLCAITILSLKLHVCLHFLYTESTSWNISVVQERLCLILWLPVIIMYLVLLPVGASTKAIRYCELLRMKTGLQGNILSTLKLHPMLLLPFCWNMWQCCIFLEPSLRSLVMMQNKGWFLGLVFSVLSVGFCLLNDARRRELLL